MNFSIEDTSSKARLVLGKSSCLVSFDKETQVVTGVSRKIIFQVLETPPIQISKLGMNSKNTFVCQRLIKEGQIDGTELIASSFYITSENSIKYASIIVCNIAKNTFPLDALKEELESFTEVLISLFRLKLDNAEVEPIPEILNLHYATERKPTISKNRIRQIK